MKNKGYSKLIRNHVRRKLGKILKQLKEKICQSEIPLKLLFKNEGEMKTFSD